MDNELRRVPIHAALNRPDLLFGCERRLFLLVSLISTLLIIVAMSWFAAWFGVLLWFGGIAALRAMAKVDPMLSAVYLRHTRYRKYYPAHGTIFASRLPHKRKK